MFMENELCFVQFMHPGGEHRPDAGLFKRWNKAAHKRKFIKQAGKYLSAGNLNDGTIAFWAEWEPESEVVRTIPDPIAGGPRYVYQPFYILPESFRRLQNTDPFVFGERFHYTGCQQRTLRGPTQLRYLKRGSVIMFGSCEQKRRFVLDTVFVVDRWIDHSRGNYRQVLSDAISEDYMGVTILPWYRQSEGDTVSCAQSNGDESWRLYFGASYQNPVEGMFSFFPCLPLQQSSQGFARPVITLLGAVTDNLYQSKKINRQKSTNDVTVLWDKVVAQVQKQGLALGVYAAMPPRRM
jgi:hypothetical protein